MIWIDGQVRIAHAKTIVIDEAVTLMGSYNWTRGAAANSENLNLVSSPPSRQLTRPLARTRRGVRSIRTARGLVPSLSLDDATERRSWRRCSRRH
jgi:phosphatidylserine/phosphatidylglycerophosphate/cardiolipin synthase-like enzyme